MYHSGSPSKRSSVLGRGLPDDRGWEIVQAKTFTNWINTKLAMRGIPPMTSLVVGLADGVHLIELMEVMSDTQLGRYYRNPKMKVQMAENVNLALDFLRRRGIVLTNTGAEDIIDGNLKIILGLIWKLILRFTVQDISQEGLTARDGLLLWCQRQTAPYKPEVNVQDFHASWTDGLALCALIHRHRPELLDYYALPQGDNLASRRERTNLAFSIAEEYLNIPRLMDVADLALPPGGKPDEKSVMTYIAQYYYAFSSRQQAEAATRRLATFADLLRSVWMMRNDYERRARILLAAMQQQMDRWSTNATESDELDGDVSQGGIPTGAGGGQGTILEERLYLTARGHMDELKEYKRSTKREWVKERSDLEALLANIQTKLRTYELRPWHPQPGLGTADLRDVWGYLAFSEARAASTAQKAMRHAKDMLDARFARLANSYEDRINAVRDALSALEPSDDLDAQSTAVQGLLPRLQGEDLALHKADLVATDAACQRSVITENEGTIYNLDDLEFDQQLTEAALIKKLAFFDNQRVARQFNNTLSPAQLEQFDATFQHFNRSGTNTLSVDELRGGLASEGVVFPEEDLMDIYDQLCERYSAVNYEAFLELMRTINEDENSPGQVLEAFQAVAGDKPYVTELDLRQADLPAGALDFFLQNMPRQPHGGDGDGAEGHGPEEQMDYVAFMSGLVA